MSEGEESVKQLFKSKNSSDFIIVTNQTLHKCTRNGNPYVQLMYVFLCDVSQGQTGITIRILKIRMKVFFGLICRQRTA